MERGGQSLRRTVSSSPTYASTANMNLLGWQGGEGEESDSVKAGRRTLVAPV